MDNFAQLNQKFKHSYFQTPKGMNQKFVITKAIIRQKEKEYENLQIMLKEAKRSVKGEKDSNSYEPSFEKASQKG